MCESTDERTHHNHHHKSKGLNHENLRRNSFETYTSDNAPLYTSPPPQYTLHPSPPGSFYTYSTYTPPQQGMMYASNIPPVPAYYPYPQYIPVSGSYQTPATPLELQRDRLEKFEHLHEEQMERGMTVEESQAVDEAIQLSLLEAESMNNDHTRNHNLVNKKYRTVHNTGSTTSDEDNNSIYDDPIDIAENKALHEGIRLSLNEHTPSRHHSRSPSIIAMLTEHLTQSHIHDNIESSSSDEEHSELNSETLQNTTDPSIQYKRKSSSFSLKKTATDIAHKCSSVLNSAWHSMDHKDKHHTSGYDSNNNDNYCNTADGMVYDDSDSVVSATATIVSTDTDLYNTTPTIATVVNYDTKHKNTDIKHEIDPNINGNNVRPASYPTRAISASPLYPDVISTTMQSLNDITLKTSTEPSEVDNNNINPLSQHATIVRTIPQSKRIHSSDSKQLHEHHHAMNSNTSTSDTAVMSSHPHRKSSSSTSTSSNFDSPTSTVSSHSHQPTNHSCTASTTENGSSHNKEMQSSHSPSQARPIHNRYISPQKPHRYLSHSQPVRYASPQYIQQEILPSMPEPCRYMSPQQVRYHSAPVLVPGAGRDVSPQPGQYIVPASSTGRYVSPQQLRYALAPQPQRCMSSQQVQYLPCSTIPAPPQQQRCMSSQQMQYVPCSTIPAPQQQQRCMSPQQMQYVPCSTIPAPQQQQRCMSPLQIQYVPCSTIPAPQQQQRCMSPQQMQYVPCSTIPAPQQQQQRCMSPTISNTAARCSSSTG